MNMNIEHYYNTNTDILFNSESMKHRTQQHQRMCYSAQKERRNWINIQSISSSKAKRYMQMG